MISDCPEQSLFLYDQKLYFYLPLICTSYNQTSYSHLEPSFQGVYLMFTLDFSCKSLFEREKVQDHCIDVFLQCILS